MNVEITTGKGITTDYKQITEGKGITTDYKHTNKTL
jgi:hypothetical protein